MCNSDCPPPPQAAPPPALTNRQYYAQLELMMNAIDTTVSKLINCNDAIDMLFFPRTSPTSLSKATQLEQALHDALLQTTHLQQTITTFVHLHKLQIHS